jgi:hypothetical protein
MGKFTGSDDTGSVETESDSEIISQIKDLNGRMKGLLMGISILIRHFEHLNDQIFTEDDIEK